MRYFFIILIVFVSARVFGQLDNSRFDQRTTIDPLDSNRFYAGLRMLAFGKNNEYFDTTIEGYTLFGYQFNPFVSYFLHKNIRIDAGAYLQQDFGSSDFTTVLPTLSLKIGHRHLSFTIGTLEGALHHQLIEPIYDFERVLNNRIENGIQFQWIKEGLFADGWVNWEKMIYFNDPDQERFVAGLSVLKRLGRWGNWSVELPVQATVRHAGGQIDRSYLPLTSLYTGSIGVNVSNRPGLFVTEWGLKTYQVTHKSLTSRTLPYKDGNAFYLNPYLQTRWGLGLMASYWHGNEYLTFDGGQLYPVHTQLYPDRIHQPRQFYMIRILYDLLIADGLTLTARVEPFYDTYPETIQYSYGFYLNFSDRFFLGHAKRKKPY
jgi:hypothetical protein